MATDFGQLIFRQDIAITPYAQYGIGNFNSTWHQIIPVVLCVIIRLIHYM